MWKVENMKASARAVHDNEIDSAHNHYFAKSHEYWYEAGKPGQGISRTQTYLYILSPYHAKGT